MAYNRISESIFFLAMKNHCLYVIGQSLDSLNEAFFPEDFCIFETTLP